MRLKVRRTECDSLAETFGRFLRTPQGAQGSSQVVQGFGTVFATRGDRLFVMFYRFGKMPEPFEKIAQRIMSLRIARIDFERSQIAQGGIFQIPRLLHERAEIGKYLRGTGVDR